MQKMHTFCQTMLTFGFDFTKICSHLDFILPQFAHIWIWFLSICQNMLTWTFWKSVSKIVSIFLVDSDFDSKNEFRDKKWTFWNSVHCANLHLQLWIVGICPWAFGSFNSSCDWWWMFGGQSWGIFLVDFYLEVWLIWVVSNFRLPCMEVTTGWNSSSFVEFSISYLAT